MKKNKNNKKTKKNEDDFLFSFNLFNDVPSYYKTTGEIGETQYGAGAEDNELHNAVQAESVVPTAPYIKKDKSKKNLHKN